jgi:DNA-binding NtrC family response regulator
MSSILVVDDDLAIREMVALTLEKSGYQVQRADGYAAARKALGTQRPDLVISDLYMPGGSGLELLKDLTVGSNPPPLILMTARGSIETAAKAMKDGVFDYLAKPFDLDLMLERVRAALQLPGLASSWSDEGPASLIVGNHPAIVDVYKAIGRVAPLNVPVIILGETGTGKELVARALHRYGRHPQGPFVPVHCGAIPDTLIESELFGHRRGAFTDAQRDRIGALAQANGGTIFLDEVGEISPTFQVKLLRFLEDGIIQPLGADKGEPVSVRVVAATHRDLKAMVAAGTFREDLYYRLAGFEIRIPSLRERMTDLPALVAHFQKHFQRELGLREIPSISEAALSALACHGWPGNVRELGHVVRRILIETGSIEDEALVRRLLSTHPSPPAGVAPLRFQEPFVPLDAMEQSYILAVLASTGGNKTEAARILGIERKTIARKLKGAGEMEDLDGGES